MNTDEILGQLTQGSVLEGPHWTEPVKILTAKPRGTPIEVQAVGAHTKRLWTKLLKAEDFDGSVKLTLAGAPAGLTGDPTHFRLAAEAHRIGFPSRATSNARREAETHVTTRSATIRLARTQHYQLVVKTVA